MGDCDSILDLIWAIIRLDVTYEGVKDFTGFNYVPRLLLSTMYLLSRRVTTIKVIIGYYWTRLPVKT